MRRFLNITRVLFVLAPLAALVPLGRVAADWIMLARTIEQPTAEVSERGFDWVVWVEQDGVITASYVFPNSPAARSGLHEGDRFSMLEYQQYFNASDLQRAIEGIPPGEARTYYVRRDGEFIRFTVTLTAYPTFLYPLSPTLWHFALWGFALGAFFHLLGLIITSPLARRSWKAQFSFAVILASSLWMFGNVLRLVLIEMLGPPLPGSTYAGIFEGLTLAGLVGWIGFPALLLHKVANDTQAALRHRPSILRFLLYLPVVVLIGIALVTTLHGHLGPVTLDRLVVPILFYACCYLAMAGGLILIFYLLGLDDEAELPSGWSRPGSALLFVIAGLLALSVLGVLPLFGVVTDTGTGWLVVGAQLLAVVPVVLVTLATLRYGKLNQVLSRALTYMTVLGLIFFAFVGGVALIDHYLPHGTAIHNIAAGGYVVLLLLAFERLARRARRYAERFFATERELTREALSRFQEQMRTIVDHDTLARQTIAVVGKAFDVETACLFLHSTERPKTWITGAYHPEPPYLTELVIERIWPFMRREGRIWSANEELNESALPEGRARLLRERRAALAIPIMGDGAPIGLLILGTKRQRRAVYNLADLDLLRSLSGQLALAVERLDLVAREKTLARESAEAELVALRAQINPHFLFNALNTIISLIEERPEDAEAVVEHLAAIFRHILHAGSQPFVSLEDEFTLIDHYLNIEEARFGDKLVIELALDAALRTHSVPAFAVQTLVENAVKHGIAKKRAGGRVRIIARPGRDVPAEVVVADTGKGIPELFGREDASASPERFFGIGLRNVAARLERLYGRSDLLHLESDIDEGTTATLRLPTPPSQVESAGDGAPAMGARERGRGREGAETF